MKYLKRLTAALLALLMVLGLAACGSGRTETGVAARTDTQSPAKSAQGTETALEPGMVQVNYRAADLGIDVIDLDDLLEGRAGLLLRTRMRAE